jgi:hypothetical protein
MQPIQGFDSVQAIHGRQGALPGGPYVVVIMRAKEDVTGYGNPCLKVVYDILEGPFAGRFADINADTDQDWRHEVEVDTAEANGARLKALTDAIAASNPGWVWDWNEQNMANRVFGLVLQERKVTRTKGKNKGKDATYLDFWDAVPADAVRAGQVPTPPVNDRRTSQPQQAPVPVPASYGQQQAPVAAPVAPQAAPQAPVAQPTYQQQAPTYQQAPAPQYVPQTYQQAPAMPMADDDIPF